MALYTCFTGMLVLKSETGVNGMIEGGARPGCGVMAISAIL